MLLYKAKEAKRRWEKLEKEKDDQLDVRNAPGSAAGVPVDGVGEVQAAFQSAIKKNHLKIDKYPRVQ